QPGQPGKAIVIQAQPAVQVQPGGVIVGPANGPVVGVPVAPAGVGNPGTIILTHGTPKKLPTDASGPRRIRDLDDNSVFGGAQPNEHLLVLQATPEPRLRLMGVQSVTINRAIDDQDQALMQTVAELQPNQPVGQPNVAQPNVVQPGLQPLPP